MVKGIAKRVIVVKSPDPKVFEEAIFIVRDDYMKTAGVTRARLLAEARQAAGLYVGRLRRSGGGKTALTAAVSALLGSGVAAALLHFVF